MKTGWLRNMSLICTFGLMGLFAASSVFAMQEIKELSVFHHGLTPWTTTGDAWGLVKTPRVGEPLRPHPESQAGGEAATGTIKSPDFVITGDVITFMANGWDSRYGGKGLNGFFLKRASDNSVLIQSAPPDQDGFVKVTWLVSKLKGEKVYFEAVDNDNNENGTGPGFAWIGFDHLRMSSCDIPGNESHLYALPIPAMEGTWQILTHDGAQRVVAPYLSSLGLGEPGRGSIHSPAFIIHSSHIRLTLCGWSGRNGERHASFAELIDMQSKKVLCESPPPLTDALTPMTWDVSKWTGHRVEIRLVDDDSNDSFAWMGLGMVDALPSYSVNFALPAKGSEAPLKGWVSAESQGGDYREAGGIPFLCFPGMLPREEGGFRIPIGLKVTRLFLTGFTGSYDQGEPVWGDPNDIRHQLFIGDKLGDIILDYADGETQTYPLIYGYSAWWYQPLQDAPEPFASNPKARAILDKSLSLLSTGSGPYGAYMGVIAPRPEVIKDIRILDNPDKAGTPILSGVTVRMGHNVPASFTRLPHDRATPRDAKWIASHALISDADRNPEVRLNLSRLRNTLYTTVQDIPTHLAVNKPSDYRGPIVHFKGDVYADILNSVFYNDVRDILDKVDSTGMYHTSTKNAPSWGSYTGIGTWRNDVGSYYSQSWSRDLGRSLQEITELGYLSKAEKCADYCFRESRRWATESSLKYKGVQLPPHWCRVLNMPSPILGDGVFENDGHGLIMLFTYKLWQREPHPDTWLTSHWNDIKAAGDWVQWQLSHPDITGATDVLMTDSECAGGVGHAKYADFLCEEGLRAYADMANSIGHHATAASWIATANSLLKGIEKNYFTDDPRWGRTWTATPAGWPNQSTNLGPLIILADLRGFAPQDNLAGWRVRDLNAYLRLISNYKPFGFYGVAMGYGQGFVTQSALLLDRMQDATTMLDWLAKAIYYPSYKPYITPEGCEVDPSGKFWHRTGDLGNGVQEGETVKALRLVIGVDDDRPDRDQLIPRLPIGWREIAAADYPLLTVNDSGGRTIRHISYELLRNSRGMNLSFRSDGPISSLNVRIGPFQAPDQNVLLNGKSLHTQAVKSGDSYWISMPTMRNVTHFTLQAVPHTR